MDEVYLSDATVVAASRKFVCARLLTYESAEEAKFLKSIYLGRSGELENTVFAILAPDGKTKLERAGRSPDFLFRRGPPGRGRPGRGDPTDLVQVMERIAKKYPGKRSPATPPVPLLADVRDGLNVGACDARPLVVLVGKTPADVKAINKQVAKAAWSDDFIGRFVYAEATDQKALKPIAKPPTAQVLFVAPDSFGLKGEVLASVKDASDAEALHAAFEQALAKWNAPRKADTRRHVRAGNRAGVHWETEIPVTDPGKPPGGRPSGRGR